MQRETKDRLIREGKWAKFNEIREHLKKQGEAPAMCETKALLIVDTKVDSGGDPYRRLVLAAPTGGCSEREACQFVFEYAACQPADIPEEVVPSRGAVGLLKWAQSSPSNASAFYATMWTKLMPTKSQLDAEARYSDDGVRSLELLGRLEQMLDAPREDEEVSDMRADAAGDALPQELEEPSVGVPLMQTNHADATEVRGDAAGLLGDVRDATGAGPDHTDTSGEG